MDFQSIYYGRPKNPPPTPQFTFFEILPCFLHTLLALRGAYIKQGNKIRIYFLFLTTIPFFSSLSPTVFTILPLLFIPFFSSFPFPPFFPVFETARI